MKPRKRIIRKGARREALIARLRCSFSCPASASIQEKMDRLEEYAEEHPEYSHGLLAEVAGVNRGAFHNHIYNTCRGNRGSRHDHRLELEAAIVDMSEDWTHTFPGINTIVDELHFRGLKCGNKTIMAIMRDLGYDRALEKMI